jgi:hypothetical protein
MFFTVRYRFYFIVFHCIGMFFSCLFFFFFFFCFLLQVPYYLENKPRGLFKSETPAARVRGWVRFSEVSV